LHRRCRGSLRRRVAGSLLDLTRRMLKPGRTAGVRAVRVRSRQHAQQQRHCGRRAYDPAPRSRRGPARLIHPCCHGLRSLTWLPARLTSRPRRLDAGRPDYFKSALHF
jgi:hypothetical protein